MNAGFKFRSVPFVMSAAALLIICGTTWKSVALKHQNDELRDTLSAARGESAPGAIASSGTSGGAAPGGGRASAATGVSPVADEQAAMARAKERVEKASALLGVKPDDEVKSFGRIETLASEGLAFIEQMKVFSKAVTEPSDNELEKDDFMGGLMDWVPKSDILSALEEQPAKIGKFHAAALREALSLDGPTVARLQPAIQAEFEKLAARKLTRPQRPDDGQFPAFLEKPAVEKLAVEKLAPSQSSEAAQRAWYKMRDTALAEAAGRIEALIPEDRRKPFVVEQVLHLGTGMRTTTHMNPDNSGHGSVSIDFRFPGIGVK